MQLEQEQRGKEETGNTDEDAKRIEALGGMLEIEGKQLASLAKWINSVLPQLNLSLETSEEELRDLLNDESTLCLILDKLVPGSMEIGSGSSPNEPVNVKKILAAMEELGLPKFKLSELEQGSMVPVLQSLLTMKNHFAFDAGQKNILSASRKRWDHSGASIHHNGGKSNELLELKQGSHVNLLCAKIMELPSNSLDSASTQWLFHIGNRILGDIFEKMNGGVPHRASCLLRAILQVIEWRFSNQAEGLKKQDNLLKACEGKYRSRISALETLVVGTTQENELEKTKLEKKELEEQDIAQVKRDKVRNEIEISALKQELETAKRAHEEHCLQLELDVNESKADYEKRIGEHERDLANARKQVKELKTILKSRSLKWKDKEHIYNCFLNDQFGAFQEVRDVMESVKEELFKTKRSYSEEFKSLGMKLKGLAEAAGNYHELLAENRKLYNEVQDLKGQSQKHTTIELVGDNGELIVSNPLQQGKESCKLFKFNKVFGPSASQEEVFMDTRPLIRSVLDGYNVCIFAYGQTGSGKTYTMSGPSLSSKSDWGVNYRALHDLFQISQSRRDSIAYEVGVQMVEIYNEQVRDLLSINGIWNTAQPNGLVVPDASMHSVNSMTDVLELMNIGMMNRATSTTALNERSSRSHSVLTVHVRGTDLGSNTLLRSCLHLVDLAGSERVNRSEAKGNRLKEAQHINKSLSALGDVIFALAQKSQHVPYRNSKLTQLLQSSLGGQAKTLMFVQLNPDVASYSETVSTLKFAKRVSGVELGAARSNKEGKDVRQLMEQLTSLKDELLRKDEEIERLKLLKENLDVPKRGMVSSSHGSSFPRGPFIRTPHHSPKLSGVGEKEAFDMDNCSEYSEKHLESGSLYSMDDLRNKPVSLRLKLAGEDVGQNFNEVVELIGIGDANSEEKLSDISDGDLSIGTETDGSISNIVEHTLFPDMEKPTEISSTKSTTEKIPADNTEKIIMQLPSKSSKAPQVTQKVQIKSSRMSLNSSFSSLYSSVRKATGGSSSSLKPPKR
ncbi:kinesin-like protein KIN-14J isoform X1 [Senna tora]|uniref:Kinesin-like protein KIN-14J isoform X1 n=1 Tax=Senna tora TaxID=362788 RepID=A0A834TWY1_9FABA|nr:kinesin-like protein KIN-14J isoform X1 [Senna tora]